MVFVTAIRDYIDWINAGFDALGQEMSAVQFMQQTLLYLASSLKLSFLYIITFQWLRDLAYLPILIPQYTEAIVKEQLYFTSNPVVNVFSFAETPTLLQNKFIVGFFNSLFAALPFSCAHLIALRRFYIQGWPAAAATNLGIILAQTILLLTVLFGCRGVIIPWLQFEPWNYIIGLTIILRIAFDMGQAAGVTQYRRFAPEYRQVFLAMGAGSFVLTLCEQSLIFQHINNLTFGLEPSFIEPTTSTSLNLTAQHCLYVAGFVLGSIFFTYAFYWAAVGFRFVVTQIFRITQVRFHAYYHQYSKLFITTLALSSVPFYGFDYFVTNPLGFVPYDTALTPGIFAPNSTNDLTLKSWGGQPDENKDLPQDQAISGFDRGIFMRYMVGKVNPEDLRTPNVFGTPEDYTIPVEYAWLTEFQRRPAIRYDFILRHKKTLERFYGWLEQTGTGDMLAKMTGTETTQERQDRAEREKAEKLKTEKEQALELQKRRSFWVPENFGQFSVRDNYTRQGDPFVRHPNKSEVDKAYWLSRKLFGENAFEVIDDTQSLVDELISEIETQTREPGDEDTGVEASASQFPNFVNYQNFHEKVHYTQLEHIHYNEETALLALPWVWPGLNSYFPEDIQDGMLPVHSFFRGPKQRKAQEVFYQSPYYKLLMRTDIDAFLARQPKTHLLTNDEETELYYKRSMLSDYYNSLRKYKRMNNSDEFKLAYGGAKSFAHQAFNHQFKGTYRVARRLFAIDLSPENHPDFPEKRNRVFKYDMPLFDDTESHNPMIHEELQKARDVKREAAPSTKRTRRSRRPKPFFKPVNTNPLYCGWDETKRQFVLTNRLLPRKMAGMRMKVPQEFNGYRDLAKLAKQEFDKQPAAGKGKRKRKENEIVFTWWPIPAKVANDRLLWDNRRGVYANDRGEYHKLDEDLDVVFVTRFNPDYDLLPQTEKTGLPEEKGAAGEDLDFDPWTGATWPSGFGITKLEEPLGWWAEAKPPVAYADRGGIVWPGHETLKIDLETFIPSTIRPMIEQAREFYREYLTG